MIVTRTPSTQHRESVRAGSPAAPVDADEEYACDTVRDDAGESAHAPLVDIEIEIEIDADFQLDIDISGYE